MALVGINITHGHIYCCIFCEISNTCSRVTLQQTDKIKYPKSPGHLCKLLF